MSPVSLIPSSQSDALVHEIERQFRDESNSIAADAQRDARAIMAQARGAARRLVRDAIQQLREEGARRLSRAGAQLDTEMRARAQQQAVRAVRDALPLLHEALIARWRERGGRNQWIEAAARFCVDRLAPGAWDIEHPRDWSELERQQFLEAVGNGVRARFEATDDITAGLRVSADRALLDVTPSGLLADSTTIAALLLEEIGVA